MISDCFCLVAEKKLAMETLRLRGIEPSIYLVPQIAADCDRKLSCSQLGNKFQPSRSWISCDQGNFTQ